MLDLQPATGVLTRLIEAVRDDQLDASTPCSGTTVGDLLDHVDGFCAAFTAAATKTPLDPGTAATSADATRLGSDWRVRIPDRLAELTRAWRPEHAWSGMTHAGGMALPAQVAGTVALDEVVVHGWDVAVATGQEFTCDDEALAAAYEYVRRAVAEHPNGSPGLFGPPVPVPPGAPLVDRLIGLTGRDPAWQAVTSRRRRAGRTGRGRRSVDRTAVAEFHARVDRPHPLA